MNRLAIVGSLLITLVVFYPHIGSGANIGNCPFDQSVTLDGTINLVLPDTVDTDLECVDGNDNLEIDLSAAGEVPSSCQKGSHFHVSGTTSKKESNEAMLDEVLGSVYVKILNITCN